MRLHRSVYVRIKMTLVLKDGWDQINPVLMIPVHSGAAGVTAASGNYFCQYNRIKTMQDADVKLYRCVVEVKFKVRFDLTHNNVVITGQDVNVLMDSWCGPITG